MPSRARSQKSPATERVHPHAEELDVCSVKEVVSRLHREDELAVKAVGRVLSKVAQAARAAQDALASGGRLLYVGAGTSGRLGALDAAECPPTFGTSPEQVVAVIAGGHEALWRAVEGAEDDARAGAAALRQLKLCAQDFVVGISASATTPFVLGALEAAREAGARTALVSSNPPAKRDRAAELLICVRTGPELIAGSTRLKAGTATRLVLNAISTAAMVGLGKVYRGRMVALRPTNAKLRARAERMVAELGALSVTRARALLERAGWSPRLALAMHFTGMGPEAAQAELELRGLRGLDAERRPARRRRATSRRV